MSGPDRLLRLLQLMRVMAPPITAERLAAERGVSVRSIYRDIELLRLSGARIEGERGYGYRLIEDYALPPQTFDRLEIEAITVGLGEVRQMGDPDLARAAESVLAKVAATLPDDREQQLLHSISHVYRPRGRYGLHPHLQALRQACWEEQEIEIGYRDQAGTASQRIIRPLAIMYSDHVLTVLAWCCLRDDFRMFRVDRIEGVLSTGASFRPRRVSLLREYLAKLSEK
ncbi:MULTISPECIES: helix-turn-helix transcriptional regulator [Rhizobium/Agrobacterium group]|uniref:helix-turn-helix transcriptional regulator n=1 Tax=Rhizobium/Agrobacterium group TaxID=227290 RepID=UPI0015721328|nr:MULTISPECIES: YafY family protein [Rhizobium/Agrobacterium group]MCF1475088.1 YafY family transcriptional regulator [Allorhizobium ampelinum]NSZ55498.1 YafY family transcriptional regulator [Agrobacterium vitis]NTA34564.1 YafY family transcriptional regulator [Agrobacterium vitis]